jgi:EpsI family protein
MSVLLAGSMALASGVGIMARPTHKAVDAGRTFDLETMVPRSFGDWKELSTQGAQVVNPQTQELLDKLYSQLLTRTYVNSQGYRVMLSLAYGDDQRGGLTAHRPDICYPAQGFTLAGRSDTTVATPFGGIAARRLSTSLGARKEPVTYWFNVGDTPVRNQLEQRMVEMRLGILGQVPDGLLFRVSSIDETPERAYRIHDAFVRDLLGAVDASARMRLAGLKPAAPG